MTTLSPSGGSRRRSTALPVVLAVVAALAVGLAGGWWFAGRGQATTAGAGPSSSSTCHSASTTGSSRPTSTKKASGKPTASRPAVAVLPSPSAITVNVFNATARSGLARTTSVELAGRGFRIGNVANDPSRKIIAASAEIRFGPAGLLAAKVVAAQVPAPVMVPDHRRDASVDFVLGDGYSSLATPQQAAATLAALPTLPTPSPTRSSGC